MYGDFPAKNTVRTPYIPINVWFWPTLFSRGGSAEALRTLSADAHATAQAEWCLPDRVMVLARWKCWGTQDSQCRRPCHCAGRMMFTRQEWSLPDRVMVLARWKCWGTQDSQCRRPCHCAGRMMFTRQDDGSYEVEVLRHSGLSVQTPMPLRRQNDVYQTGWWFF